LENDQEGKKNVVKASLSIIRILIDFPTNVALLTVSGSTEVIVRMCDSCFDIDTSFL
jgi:hypothetical protein